MKKKLIIFILFLLAAISVIIFLIYGKEFPKLSEEKKIYSLENVQSIKIDTLDEFKLFNDGIITYNNQKIIFLNYSNRVLWENENTTKQVFLNDKYIFRDTGDKIQAFDKNGRKFILAEIKGNILNVSRENDKVYVVVKSAGEKNSLYIVDENNKIIDNKVFKDNVTSVSISDKSEGYSLTTLRLENQTVVNTVYFNLLDDIELWNIWIENEILIKDQIVNNNVILIGTKNIYYFNTNGKLMWKNGVYNKILDYNINKGKERIYILYDKEKNAELISYDFEGKVKDVVEVPKNVKKIKIYSNKIFAYSEESLYLIHKGKTDKIYEDLEGGISDFIVEDNYIHIISKNKLVSGEIK